MYNIASYGVMLMDSGRMGAYSAALQSAVNADSVVLDIGAGPGIFTLLACQAGARKVYAIEPDGSIEVAREAAAANGFADRVESIQALSTEISLPERVDVIVASIQGALPLFGSSVFSLIDARTRFLKPGGVMIPLRETLLAALVSAPEFHARIIDPWESRFGFNYQPARKRAVNTSGAHRFKRESILAEPQTWAVLDYSRLQSPNAKGEAEWTLDKPCEAHGLAVWFDCETAPGVCFSNAPGVPDENVFRQTFFPWPDACKLDSGDKVAVEIRADFVSGDYIFTWNTRILSASGAERAQFRQSHLYGSNLSRDLLRKSGSAFVPQRKPEAEVDQMILQLFSEGLNLEEISRKVAGCFPQRFPEWRKALTRVGEMSVRYSE